MVAFEIGNVIIYETSNGGSVQMKIVNVGGDGRLDLECEKGGKNKADPERSRLVKAEIPASTRHSVAERQEGIPFRERGTADFDLNNSCFCQCLNFDWKSISLKFLETYEGCSCDRQNG